MVELYLKVSWLISKLKVLSQSHMNLWAQESIARWDFHFLLFAFVAVLLEIIQILDRLIIQLVIYLRVSESAEIFIFSQISTTIHLRFGES